MKSNIFHLIAILSLLMCSDFLQAQKLVTFPEIPGRTPSDKYICRIRQVGTDEWKDAFVIQTTCKNNPDENKPPSGPDNGYFKMLDGWSASYISFEFSGAPVEVEIAKVGGAAINKAMVRPAGHAQAAQIIDGKAYIVFDKPANINVDIDGQMEDKYTGMGYNGPAIHTISIFGNPVYKEPSSTNSRVISLNPGQTIPSNHSTWDTIWFKPGIHNIGTPFTIHSNKVLHIPGNAIVHGTIHPPNAWGNSAAKNWSVYGSGTISGENILWTGDETTSAKTFTYQAEAARLEGFVVIDPANHTFNMGHSGPDANVNIYKNIKIFGWRKNSDGINAFRNSVISDCFIRVQDDVFYYGGDNVKISNCVTWNDANGAVLFVTKGATSMNTSFVKDIKVIYHRAYWHYWDGGRVISFRDRKPGNTIRNVQIRNVLIEDPYPAFPPFFLKMSNPDNSNAGVHFENIIIENVSQPHPAVTIPGREVTRNTMLGLDDARKFRNITFQNCYYNGKWLGSFEDGDFLINRYIENNIFILDHIIPTSDYILTTTSANGVIRLTFSGEKPDEVVVTATPYEGYHFNGWSGDLSGTGNPAAITMNKNKAITANFSAIATTYTLSTNAINGTITLNPPSANGKYSWGKEVTLTAVGNSGYAFQAWGGDITGKVNPVKIIMDSDKSVFAYFSDKPVTSVRIGNVPSRILVTGEKHQLSAIIIPDDAADKSVSWSSSNSAIAVVDGSGLITAVSEGATTIIVTTNDGGFRHTANVGVMSSGIAVTDVTLSGCPLINLKADSTYQLRATITPANAGDLRVRWSSSNETVASVDERGLVRAVSEGEATIAVTTNLGGLTKVCSITVDSQTTNVNIDVARQFVNVYPNPVSGFLYFKFSEANSEKKISFYNVMGQLLHSITSYDAQQGMDIRKFSKEGMLIVRVVSGEEMASFKVTVKN